MRLNKKELQAIHDRLHKIAYERDDTDMFDDCRKLQNHIYTLEDDDSGSNPPGDGRPGSPGGTGHP